MAKSENRRRLYTIEPRLRTFFCVVLAATALLVALFAAFTFLIRDAQGVAFPTIFGQNVFLLMFVTAFFMCGSATGLAIYAIVQTHRILGAAWQIHSALEEMKEGREPTKVVLRKGDYLRKIADDVNDISGRMAAAGR